MLPVACQSAGRVSTKLVSQVRVGGEARRVAGVDVGLTLVLELRELDEDVIRLDAGGGVRLDVGVAVADADEHGQRRGERADRRGLVVDRVAAGQRDEAGRQPDRAAREALVAEPLVRVVGVLVAPRRHVDELVAAGGGVGVRVGGAGLRAGLDAERDGLEERVLRRRQRAVDVGHDQRLVVGRDVREEVGAGAIADDGHVHVPLADRQAIVAELEREVALVVGTRAPDVLPGVIAAREQVDVLVLECLVDRPVRDPALDRLGVGVGVGDEVEAAVVRVERGDQVAGEVVPAARPGRRRAGRRSARPGRRCRRRRPPCHRRWCRRPRRGRPRRGRAGRNSRWPGRARRRAS